MNQDLTTSNSESSKPSFDDENLEFDNHRGYDGDSKIESLKNKIMEDEKIVKISIISAIVIFVFAIFLMKSEKNMTIQENFTKKEIAKKIKNDKNQTDFKNHENFPIRELFVPSGSWNPLDLMLVVENEKGSVLAINGRTHTPIGRVKKMGSKVHTQVASPDGNFSYFIARNGWLTKIDLRTLEPIAFLKVGEKSRGTALTDDGKIVAVGNYEPKNVVLVDAETFKIVKKIELSAMEDGKMTNSRAGALVEFGDKIFIALKDLAAVWMIDTSEDGMPVKNRWTIGGKDDEVHDGYITPDGKYFILAMQRSNQVWVLDLNSMKPIAKVKTGIEPHTGTGAQWGNTTFVPALGEGIITAIDTKTWKTKARIKLNFPGMFIRSYSDPKYPYIWADTFLGDEIYVIDGKKLKIVKTITPMKNKLSIHPEFTRDGKFVYISVWKGDKIHVYDSLTFELVKTIDATTPTGIFSIGSRIEEPGI